MNLLFTETKKPVPVADGRGRPAIYNLDKLKVGHGKEVWVDESESRSMCGKFHASASYYGIAIKTEYDKNAGIMTVWRIPKKQKKGGRNVRHSNKPAKEGARSVNAGGNAVSAVAA